MTKSKQTFTLLTLTLVIFTYFLNYQAHACEFEKSSVTAIERPKPLHKISPKYPKSAARAGKEGWVKFNFVIDETGNVTDITPSDRFGSRDFIKEGKKALKQWKYTPAIENGKPVLQCANDILISFQMGDEQKISPDFYNKYSETLRYLEKNNSEKALGSLKKFLPKRMNNMREYNYMHSLWIEYAKLIDDEELQLKHLNKVFLSSSHESEDYKYSVLKDKLLLQIKYKKFKRAKTTYKDLQSLKNAKPFLSTFEQLMINVDDIVNSDQEIFQKGLITNKAYWRHYLIRNEFSVFDANGDLDRLEIRCANKRNIYKIKGPQTWKIPKNWKQCSIDVYGAENSTFAVIEHPNSA
jgi:TonB family protein